MNQEPDVTVFVCGTKLCTDGKPHDDLERVPIYGETGRVCGESLACSRCGSSSYERDLLELP